MFKFQLFKLHLASSLAVLAMFNSDAIAQRGPASYVSLEDMVHNSEDVLLGRILAIDGEHVELGQATCKIRFEVEEAIKGGNRDREHFYLFNKREQIESWIKSRARLVLRSPSDIANTSSESARIMIDFAEPSLTQLSLGEDGVLTHVDTEKDVLKILRAAAQRLPGVVQMLSHQVPTGHRLAEQANLSIGDGGPLVYVPIDKPLETWAKWAISGDTPEIPLEFGVRALKHFKSEANIEWVRQFIETETDDRNRRTLKGLLDEWNTQGANESE